MDGPTNRHSPKELRTRRVVPATENETNPMITSYSPSESASVPSSFNFAFNRVTSSFNSLCRLRIELISFFIFFKSNMFLRISVNFSLVVHRCSSMLSNMAHSSRSNTFGWTLSWWVSREEGGFFVDRWLETNRRHCTHLANRNRCQHLFNGIVIVIKSSNS